MLIKSEQYIEIAGRQLIAWDRNSEILRELSLNPNLTVENVMTLTINKKKKTKIKTSFLEL